MAEAVVNENAIPRFYCHKCKLNILNVLPNVTCPNCHLGFVEELECLQENVGSDKVDVQPPMGTVQPLLELSSANLGMQMTNLIQIVDGPNPGGEQRRQALATLRMLMPLGRPGNVTVPRLPAGSRVVRDGQSVPLEIFISDFFQQLISAVFRGSEEYNHLVLVEINEINEVRRQSLDVIINQLAENVDDTGPPPLPLQKLREIPFVGITQEQVDNSLQCSICYEAFEVNEQVRKLECKHMYHDECITRWLKQNGTCPMCRKDLAESTDSDAPLQSSHVATNNAMLNPQTAVRGRSEDEPGSSNASSSDEASSVPTSSSKSSSDSDSD